MKIVSDFDGVWTDPRPEAATVLDVLCEELARACGWTVDRVREQVEQTLAAIDARPEVHGWWIGGAISAFADEDPFCRNNALCSALAVTPGELGRAVQGPLGGAAALSKSCYEKGTGRALAERGPHLVAGAADVVRELSRLGFQIVVASNSSPQKLLTWFSHAGVSASEGEGAAVRVRGNAMKFSLEPEPPPPGGSPERRFAGRTVRIDRGRYHRLLREERPDLVIGDVFSLDHALPRALRDGDGAFRNLHLVLRRGPYTPAWALGAWGTDARDGVVTDLREFPALASRLVH